MRTLLIIFKRTMQVDEFIRWTLYGVKPDTAKPPLKSLQVGGDPATGTYWCVSWYAVNEWVHLCAWVWHTALA